MRRSSRFAFLFALILLVSCSSRLDLTKSSTQLEVGVRAARDNLWREAFFRFQRAVQLEPQNAMAHNNLAVAYEGIGEFEKARSHYTEALRLDRANQYIQRNYSRFVEFYSKNRKRESQMAKGGETTADPAKPPATPASTQPPAQPVPAENPPPEPSAPPAQPVTAQNPPPDPVPVPMANPNEPGEKPVTAPPETGKPDSPPFRGI